MGGRGRKKDGEGRRKGENEVGRERKRASEFTLTNGDRKDHGRQWIRARVQVIGNALSLVNNLCLWWLVRSLSLSLSSVDPGNDLKVKLKCKKFYTLGLLILPSKISIFRLTKFSTQTKHSS